MKTKHQFTSWWVNLFSHLLPSFLLAKIIPWHFHVFHIERAQMDGWNAASNCTENRVLALAQPQMGSMGGITSKWFLPGSNGKQECLTLGQQMDTERKPNSSSGPCPGAEGGAEGREAKDQSKLTTLCPYKRTHLQWQTCAWGYRSSCGVLGIFSTQRAPQTDEQHWWTSLAPNEWAVLHCKENCSRKPGGNHLSNQG